MNILGLLIFVVGLVGLVIAFVGITGDIGFLPPGLRGVPPWGIITAFGAVLYFFTRRAKD